MIYLGLCEKCTRVDQNRTTMRAKKLAMIICQTESSEKHGMFGFAGVPFIGGLF